MVVQTISPRIFEASAFENTLVLHEGYYDGMLQPDLHYISVRKDYSNVRDVVERMKDRSFCERLARNARLTAEQRFHSDRLGAEVYSLYRDVLKRGTKPLRSRLG